MPGWMQCLGYTQRELTVREAASSNDPVGVDVT